MTRREMALGVVLAVGLVLLFLVVHWLGERLWLE